jgi:uncharacterized Zn ribbon protein
VELDISKMAEQVMSDIRAVCEEEQKDLDAVMHELAKETCEEVKRTSPVYGKEYSESKIGRESGDYKNGWRVTRELKYGDTIYVVKNTKAPSLTHIFEFGTAQRKTKFGANRGQVDSKKYAHIRKSFYKMVNRYKSKFEQGG